MTLLHAYLLSPSGLVLIPLGVCSILSLALILDKIFTMVRLARPSAATRVRVRSLIAKGETVEAIRQLEDLRLFFADAVGALAAHADQDKELRDEATSLALQATGRQLSKRLTQLLTIAGLAPLLGLLGTVIGLMVAFRSLETTSGPVEPSILASGLWQAMITTVVGLTIAVPCMVAHAWLKVRIAHAMEDAASLLSELSLGLAYRRGRSR